MKIRFFFTACFLVVFCTLNAQKVGTWTTYLACYTTTSVAETENFVYAVADGTLYRYGKDDKSINKVYSTQTGLNDTDIKIIRYNPSLKKLLVVYRNGNIDMMDEDDNITNIPSIKNSSIIQDKTVNFIYFDGNTAYLAAGFGIWVYQMDKGDAVGTYLNTSSYGVCIRNEFIYASTPTGIQKGSVNANLRDPANWATVNTNSSDFKSYNIRELYLFNNMVCFRADSSGVYYLDENDKIHTMRSDKNLIGMKLESDYLIPFTSATAYFYKSLANPVEKMLTAINDISSLKNNGNFWVASGGNGILGVKRTTENQYDIFASGSTVEGPKRNLDAYMTVHNGKLLITGGGRWENRYGNAGTLMVYEDGKWFNFDERKVNNKVGTCRDYTSVAVDPNDENHYFVSTFGEGILEFKNNEFVQQYSHKNSPLQSALPKSSSVGNYVRVGSVTYDKSGNLWMTNCSVDKGILKLTSDGTWDSSFSFPGVRNADLVDKILITSKGHKWVNVPRSTPGILIFDDDKNYNFVSTLSSGSSGTSIRSNVCLSMAEDLNGTIWIGTSQGPVYCSSPSNAIDRPDALTFSHIILQDDNDENYVFLESEQINAIAVDGGNRKWLGTSGSGVYVISEDGKETIHHFTAENSDLYSNTIQSIAINHQTGEVFIGTDKGLISYQSESTEASESYSDVYAYPNPVRPDFDNQVVITGLMANSNVKITDLSGNLIYQGKSAGGQMVWDCRNRSGNRVATGIYLVLSSTEKAKESVVAKIAVVK
ncbi:MAG: hypothetical protein LBV72_13680 [Tannerella sp.]|jgi:hypothetical protein|nr:hypothetical protein [Tannerella sp.]